MYVHLFPAIGSKQLCKREGYPVLGNLVIDELLQPYAGLADREGEIRFLIGKGRGPELYVECGTVPQNTANLEFVAVQYVDTIVHKRLNRILPRLKLRDLGIGEVAFRI